MKTIIFTLIFVLFSIEVYTQSNLIIRTKAGTGTYTSFSLDDIDRIDFAPCGIVDYGGQTYYTVKIGDQCWLAQNLNIGTMIQVDQNQIDNSTIEKYCYNNELDSCDIYGGLYQWNEAVQYTDPSEGTQGICPEGWHIPTSDEFITLQTTVGGNTGGNSLKAVGQGTGSGAGTNTSGFSALLAGYCYGGYAGSFLGLGDYGNMWTSTPDAFINTQADNFVFYSFNSSALLGTGGKTTGFSVRCIKD